jgi:hypothetical protein
MRAALKAWRGWGRSAAVRSVMYVLRKVWVPGSGEQMRGGLRWPYYWPFQVTCVLVAVLLTAAFSLKPCLSLRPALAERAGRLPTPDVRSLGSLSLGSLGGQFNANTIAIISNPNVGCLAVACDPSDAADDGDNFFNSTRGRHSG